jgi:hypothetical protein
MSDEAGAELGIAPTGDQALVRRAYAGRLKAIDADRDPPAFMRLRDAYVRALAAAEEIAAGDAGAPYDDERDEDDAWPDGAATSDHDTGDAADPASTPPTSVGPSDHSDAATSLAVTPAPMSDFSDDALARFRVAYRSALEEGDARAAVGQLTTGLAAGVVPLGEEQELARQLAHCALADATLSPEELEAIRRTFGMATPRIGDRPADARQQLSMRLEAQRWKDGILRDAGRGDRWVIGYVLRLFVKRVRIARAIRDPADHNLISRDVPAFRKEVVNARRYAKLLAAPFDPLPLEGKLKGLRETLVAHEILAVFIVIIVAPCVGFTEGWEVAVGGAGLFLACAAWLFLAE